ncbi:MAG: hypothetical protein F6K28_35320 [Microcoleus sp. SIO2G3]|nr:hypothetical protein [Microcoleus sp. SIO2G3]
MGYVTQEQEKVSLTAKLISGKQSLTLNCIMKRSQHPTFLNSRIESSLYGFYETKLEDSLA